MIKAGDLVMVVRECSPGIAGGLVFRVSAVLFHEHEGCLLCGGDHTGLFAYAEEPFGRFHCTRAPTGWLKKLDDPSVEDEVRRERELESIS